VLEVDEQHLPAVVRETRPDVVVLLNLSRDQQSRNHEVAQVARRWRDALAGSGATVVANATDPNTVHAAGEGATWVRPAHVWDRDARACPACGHLLAWDAHGWSCPSCGGHQPQAQVAVVRVGGAVRDRAQGCVDVTGQRVPVALALPGAVNLDNAASALAVASLLGVPPAVAAARLRGVEDVAGRYRRLRGGGRPVRLLLAKNPAGWEAALEMLPVEGPLALGVNARGVDSRDTSWLWDVDLAALHGRPVGVFGEAADDLALRLLYEGVATVQAGTLAGLAPLLEAGELTAVANYTAFREVLRAA
jgi:UDP-N-acetylmuramyl tripeptide synthase